MRVYADASVLIAWFHADDIFAKQVTPWIQGNLTEFIWNSLLRNEVRHNLRQLEGNWKAITVKQPGTLCARRRTADVF